MSLEFKVLPPGRYAGMVEKVRYTFTATTRIIITYRLDTPDGIRRVEETILISAPPSSASHYRTTHGLGRVEDILRIKGLTLADARGCRRAQVITGFARRRRARSRYAEPAHGRVRLPRRGARRKTVTRQKKPHEYAKDADPFVVFGIDAEWVFESAGKNRICRISSVCSTPTAASWRS